jgi:hypothetical protein
MLNFAGLSLAALKKFLGGNYENTGYSFRQRD